MLKLVTDTNTSVTLPSVFHTFLPQTLSLLKARLGQEIESRSGSGLASQPWTADPLALKLGEESHAITCDINHVLQKHILSLSPFHTEGLHFFSRIMN